MYAENNSELARACACVSSIEDERLNSDSRPSRGRERRATSDVHHQWQRCKLNFCSQPWAGDRKM